MRVWSLSSKDNSSILLKQKKDSRCNIYAENTRGTRVRGWSRKNTRIGPALDMEVCYRDDRYSIEVQIPSLFQDHTVSWVRIVNGVDKTWQNRCWPRKKKTQASGKPIAKARPRRKPTVTLTSVSIIVTERKWIDIETQRSHDHKCYEVSEAITRLLRHDQSVPRGSDGAIHYSDIIEECRKKKFDGASQWFLEDWISTLAKGGGAKKRFQSCVNPDSSNQFLYLRAIQRHQEKVSLFLRCKTMYCYRKDLPSTSATSGTRTISKRKNGLIPGGTSLKRGRQAVFIRTVNPMEDVHGIRETPCDLRKPRITPCKKTWKRSQNIVFWCNLKLAQEKGLSILPNTVTCRLSLQYTVCSLHWESGRYENPGRSSTKRCTELRECHESC